MSKIYTAVQKFGQEINVFKISLLCSPKLHLLDKKHNNIVKYYYNLK